MTDAEYIRPQNLAEACEVLAGDPEQAVVLAGGTDLVVDLRAGISPARILVDIKQLPELSTIRWSPDGDLMIGTAVTVSQLAADAEIRERFPALAEGARAILERLKKLGVKVCVLMRKD